MAKKKQQSPKKQSRGKPVVARRTPKRRTAAPVLSARAVVKPVKMRMVTDADAAVVAIEPALVIEPSWEMISQRASENWAAHVRMANDPVAVWLEAEAQLRAELNRQ